MLMSFNFICLQLLWSFQPSGWWSWCGTPVLVCTVGVLYPTSFNVPLSLCKGQVALQATEHLQGEMFWGNARKQHWTEQMGPPCLTGCFGEGEESRQWLLPRMWPQDATARTRHAPVHKLAFYLLQKSDGQWNIVFQEPQENKSSESFWCALETNLSAFLVSQQKVVHSPFFLIFTTFCYCAIFTSSD